MASHNRRDPLVRMAMMIQSRVIAPKRTRDAVFDDVLHYARELSSNVDRSHQARQRHWHAAARLMDQRALDTAYQLQSATNEAVRLASRSREQLRPSLRDLYQELLQLQGEFHKTAIDLKAAIVSSDTESIELDDIYLGPFRIELHLDRLPDRVDASAFDIIAPRSPSSGVQRRCHAPARAGPCSSAPVTHRFRSPMHCEKGESVMRFYRFAASCRLTTRPRPT